MGQIMGKIIKGIKSIFYCLLLEVLFLFADASNLLCRQKTKETKLKIAVHIHLFYPKLTGHYIRLLRNFPYNFKLIITSCSDFPEVKEKFQKAFKDVEYRVVPNKGRDLGAFIYALNEFNLEQYDLIIKLHSKSNKGQNLISPWLINNHQVLNRRYWRNSMEYALAGNKKQSAKLVKIFEEGKTGLAGAKRFFTENDKNTSEKETAATFAICEKLGTVKKIAFFAGTIFAVKGEILAPLKAFSIDDFKAINESSENTSVEYCLERIFGSLAVTRNLKIECL